MSRVRRPNRRQRRAAGVGVLVVAVLAIPTGALTFQVMDGPDRAGGSTPTTSPTWGVTEMNGAFVASWYPPPEPTWGVTEMNGAFVASWYPPPAPMTDRGVIAAARDRGST